MALPAGAAAQRIALVAHSAEHAPISVEQVEREVAQAARDAGAEVVTSPLSEARARLAAGAVPRQTLATFARAQQLIDEGWRSYLEVRPDYALSRLSEARRVAVGTLPLDGGNELVAEASLLLGAVKLGMGRQADAEVDFRLARSLAPDRPVTDAEFKPDVVAAFELAQSAKTSRVTRKLTATPKRAEIYVDGVLVGRSPIDVELAVGLHAVVARRPGYRAVASIFEVVDGGKPSPRSAEVSLKLEPAPLERALLGDKLAVGTSEKDAANALEALLLYGEVDVVLQIATVWRRGAPAVLGQWSAASSRGASCGAVVEIGYPRPSELAKAALELYAATQRRKRTFPPTLQIDARVTDGEGRPGQAGTKGPKRPWWQSPWLWAGVGGAALTVTAILLLSRDETIKPVVDVRPCDFGPNLCE
jgi:hypothetical protein